MNGHSAISFGKGAFTNTAFLFDKMTRHNVDESFMDDDKAIHSTFYKPEKTVQAKPKSNWTWHPGKDF